MPFIDDENSTYNDAAYEGYIITAGATVMYFTSQPVGTTLGVDPHVYTPIPGLSRRRIVRKEIGASGSEMEVRIARSALASYVPGSPPDPFLVTIVRFQANGEQEIFDGEVANTNIQGLDLLLRCIGKAEAKMARKAPNQGALTTCPRVLYDSWCRVNRATYVHATTVVDVTDLVVEVASVLGPGGSTVWYVGGEMVLSGEKRTIVKQSGVMLTINHPFNATLTGAITLYPGCDKRVPTCTDKYANRVNFQGIPFQPDENIHILGLTGLRST